MKKLFFAILIILICGQVFGSDFQAIKCESERLSKSLVLRNGTVTFINKEDDDQNRAVASMSPARTQMVGKALNQMLRHDGKKFHIHVENVESFNDVNDYVEIKSMEGHNIIYPINCSLK